MLSLSCRIGSFDFQRVAHAPRLFAPIKNQTEAAPLSASLDAEKAFYKAFESATLYGIVCRTAQLFEFTQLELARPFPKTIKSDGVTCYLRISENGHFWYNYSNKGAVVDDGRDCLNKEVKC